MSDIDRFVCSDLCQAAGAPAPGSQDVPATWSFTACVRCPVQEERLLGGLRPRPRPPSIRVQAQPGPAGPARR